MNRIARRLVVAAFVVLFCFAMDATGYADCGSPLPKLPQLKHQAWNQKVAPTLLRVSEQEMNANDGEGIVGFWRVTLLAEGNQNNTPPFNFPDGFMLDHGFAQWHSDGTEIMNSNRQPSTGSFCLGVWKKVGPSRYKLNHFAISFEDGVHQGYANIREDITLSDDHDSFSGSFVIANYDINGNPGPVFTGRITGKRVKLSTTIQDIL